MNVTDPDSRPIPIGFGFVQGFNAQAAVNVSMSAGTGGGVVGNVNRWRTQLGLSEMSEGEITKSISTINSDSGKIMLVDLTGTDLLRVHRGVALTAELLFAAGARRVLLPFADLPEIAGPHELLRIIARPPRAAGIELMTVHIMGSARMAADPRQGPTDASGAVRGADGLVIADASVIPTSIGVNPQETIVALALRNADRWVDRRAQARTARSTRAVRGAGPLVGSSSAPRPPIAML